MGSLQVGFRQFEVDISGHSEDIEQNLTVLPHPLLPVSAQHGSSTIASLEGVNGGVSPRARLLPLIRWEGEWLGFTQSSSSARDSLEGVNASTSPRARFLPVIRWEGEWLGFTQSLSSARDSLEGVNGWVSPGARLLPLIRWRG